MDPSRTAVFPFIPATTTPLVIDRTEDVWLIRDDGTRILDAGGGAIVSNIGHGRTEVVEAAARALGTIDYVVPVWATENRIALVEELIEQRERWQGSYVTVQSDAIDSFAPVVAALAGT